MSIRNRRRHAAAAAAVAAGLAAVVLVPGSASAAFDGRNGRIVFTHWTSTNTIEDIFSVRPGGGGLTALTTTPAVSDRDPSWNADGTRIAFHRGDGAGLITGIWTMNADGSGLAMVPNTDDGFSATWAPGGDQLAFVCPDPVGGDTEICIVNVDGSGLTQLTATPGFEGGPSWSPGGSEIAFSRTSAGGGRARLVAINPLTLVQRFITPPRSRPARQLAGLVSRWIPAGVHPVRDRQRSRRCDLHARGRWIRRGARQRAAGGHGHASHDAGMVAKRPADSIRRHRRRRGVRAHLHDPAEWQRPAPGHVRRCDGPRPELATALVAASALRCSASSSVCTPPPVTG